MAPLEEEVYVFNPVSAGTLEDHLLDPLHAEINLFERVIGEVDSIRSRPTAILP